MILLAGQAPTWQAVPGRGHGRGQLVVQHALRQSQPRHRGAVPLQPQRLRLRLRPARGAVVGRGGMAERGARACTHRPPATAQPHPLHRYLGRPTLASQRAGRGCTLASTSVAGSVGSEGMCASGGCPPSGAATSMGSPADASRSFSSAMKRVRCGSTCSPVNNRSAAPAIHGCTAHIERGKQRNACSGNQQAQACGCRGYAGVSKARSTLNPAWRRSRSRIWARRHTGQS